MLKFPRLLEHRCYSYRRWRGDRHATERDVCSCIELGPEHITRWMDPGYSSAPEGLCEALDAVSPAAFGCKMWVPKGGQNV